MSPAVTLEPADDILSDCRVCHYDELGEEAKAQVPVLADKPDDADATTVDDSVPEAFEECDLVKYTDYYEVSTP